MLKFLKLNAIWQRELVTVSAANLVGQREGGTWEEASEGQTAVQTAAVNPLPSIGVVVKTT